MFRVILLSIGLALVLAEPNDDILKCGRFMRDGLKCCNKEMKTPPDNIQECLHMPHKPPSCEMEKCVASKLGFASADGTIDKKALTEQIDKDFNNEPDLADSVKEKCVNGDLSKYGREDFCDLMKLKMCVGVEMVKKCDDWNEEGDCNGIKALADNCKAMFKEKGL